MKIRTVVCVILGGCLCVTGRASEPEAASTERSQSLEMFKYRVEAAPEWTQQFYRKSGVFGTDGIFSIALDGADPNDGTEETMLHFGDSFIGKVDEHGKPLPGNKMVNNCVGYFKGLDAKTSKLRFEYKKDADGQPATFFVPNNANARPKQYYWLGDGFLNKELDDQIYLFAYHVEMTGPNVFDFFLRDVSLVVLPKGSRPPFTDHRQLVTPLHVDNKVVGDGDFGAGILVNTEWAQAPFPDGYVYVYACLGKPKNLVAARVKPVQFENFSAWRFWNGKDWDPDINHIAKIVDSVSNELSVTPLPDGRYLLVFQKMGISDKVGMRIGTSPVGPFSEIHEIWTTPEMADEGLLPYNAKAHPALSRPGELLISYNTITLDFWKDIQKDGHIYRPRFIRLIFE